MDVFLHAGISKHFDTHWDFYFFFPVLGGETGEEDDELSSDSTRMISMDVNGPGGMGPQGSQQQQQQMHQNAQMMHMSSGGSGSGDDSKKKSESQCWLVSSSSSFYFFRLLYSIYTFNFDSVNFNSTCTRSPKPWQAFEKKVIDKQTITLRTFWRKRWGYLLNYPGLYTQGLYVYGLIV